MGFMGNYLRVRGEYGTSAASAADAMELPPRARRIRWENTRMTTPTRTTSACAENTMLALIAALDTRNYLRVRGEYVDRDRGSMRRGNYLRVRGEYTTWREDLSAGLELPPRARRILRDGQRDLENRGTTSACAENTTCILFTPHPARNYLRVRGEYADAEACIKVAMELPPRARRIRL